MATPLEMALVVAADQRSPLSESEVALKVLVRDGDPSMADHRTAFWTLHRRVGRQYGQRAAPSAWVTP